MNFLAVDVETANANMASICAIGMVYFKDGQVAQRLGFLINPEDHFDPMNISIHGIEPEDVVSAPTLKEALPLISTALVTTTIVHHTHFDKVALCRAAARHGFPEPTCAWLDSAQVARRAWDRFARRGYGLANLADEFGITFEHHDATEDAYAAGMIMLRAMADTGMSVDQWLARVKQPLRTSSKGRFAQEGNPAGPLAGEVIAFTGSMTMYRADAAAAAAAAGCDVGDGVTKDTTILVVGDQDLQRLAGHNKSAKHRKAETLIAEGARLRIVSETDFRQLVGCGGS
jgi:DNA polymerase-3 subunit epsilon